MCANEALGLVGHKIKLVIMARLPGCNGYLADEWAAPVLVAIDLPTLKSQSGAYARAPDGLAIGPAIYK